MAAALAEAVAEEEVELEARRGGRPSPPPPPPPPPPQRAEHAVMQPPPPPPRSRAPPSSPAWPPQDPPNTPRAGAEVAGRADAVEAHTPESPLSELLRRMTDERAALREARARLDFDTPAAGGAPPRAGVKRGAGVAGLDGEETGVRAADEGAFEGLRPGGAEGWEARRVLDALEVAFSAP
eukprot:6187673-Pleurochrysis_carterae.AAC.1